MTPTPDEIEALALEMRKSFPPNDVIDSRTYAAWVLTRFVRREEHCRDCCCARSWAALCEVTGGGSIAEHIENMRGERDRLRAELRGQRCNGYGYLFANVSDWPGRPAIATAVRSCPGCPACKPKVSRCGAQQGSSVCHLDAGHDGMHRTASHGDYMTWFRSDQPKATTKGDECECGHPVVHHSGLGCQASNCNCPRSRATFNSDGGRPTDAIYNMNEAELDTAIRRDGDDPCEVARRGSETIKRALAQAHKPTPNGDGRLRQRFDADVAAKAQAAHDYVYGGRTRESVSEAERQWNANGAFGAAPAKDADLTNLSAAPVPLTVELGDRTLRALATLMTDRGGEKLLAELARTEEPKS